MTSSAYPLRTGRLTVRLLRVLDVDDLTACRHGSQVAALQDWDLPYPLSSTTPSSAIVCTGCSAGSRRATRPRADARTGRHGHPPGQERLVGGLAMRELTTLLRDTGHRSLRTSRVQAHGGPEPICLGLGFRLTGEVDDGEVVARLTLA